MGIRPLVICQMDFRFPIQLSDLKKEKEGRYVVNTEELGGRNDLSRAETHLYTLHDVVKKDCCAIYKSRNFDFIYQFIEKWGDIKDNKRKSLIVTILEDGLNKLH